MNCQYISNSVENVNIDKVLRGLVKKYIYFTQIKKMRKHFFVIFEKKGRTLFIFIITACVFVVVREEMVKEKVIPGLFPDSWLDFLGGNKTDV